MKKISYLISISLIIFAFGCEPNTGTEEGKEAVKKDTIDPREGEREGEIGDGEIGGYEHNQ
jgi:hypothetical protein